MICISIEVSETIRNENLHYSACMASQFFVGDLPRWKPANLLKTYLKDRKSFFKISKQPCQQF